MFSPSEDAFWERKADRDLLCPFLICHGWPSAPPKQDWSHVGPALPGLSYRSRGPNSTPVLLPCHISLVMNSLQQVRVFYDLGTSAAWIWTTSTVVAFLLNNHRSSGWQWAVGMSEVQNTKSFLFIPGGTSYPTETTELLLVVFKAWVALYGLAVTFRGTAIPPHPIPQIAVAATLQGARLRPMERG